MSKTEIRILRVTKTWRQVGHRIRLERSRYQTTVYPGSLDRQEARRCVAAYIASVSSADFVAPVVRVFFFRNPTRLQKVLQLHPVLTPYPFFPALFRSLPLGKPRTSWSISNPTCRHTNKLSYCAKHISNSSHGHTVA